MLFFRYNKGIFTFLRVIDIFFFALAPDGLNAQETYLLVSFIFVIFVVFIFVYQSLCYLLSRALRIFVVARKSFIYNTNQGKISLLVPEKGWFSQPK